MCSGLKVVIGSSGVISAQLIPMIPYLVTVIVLTISSVRNRREDQPPAALGINYYREER